MTWCDYMHAHRTRTQISNQPNHALSKAIQSPKEMLTIVIKKTKKPSEKMKTNLLIYGDPSLVQRRKKKQKMSWRYAAASPPPPHIGILHIGQGSGFSFLFYAQRHKLQEIYRPQVILVLCVWMRVNLCQCVCACDFWHQIFMYVAITKYAGVKSKNMLKCVRTFLKAIKQQVSTMVVVLGHDDEDDDDVAKQPAMAKSNSTLPIKATKL